MITQSSLFSIKPKRTMDASEGTLAIPSDAIPNGMYYNPATMTYISYVHGDKFGEWTQRHREHEVTKKD